MFVYVMRLSGDYISDSEGGGQIITIDYRGCPEARNWIFLRLDLVSAAKSWSWSSLGGHLEQFPHNFHDQVSPKRVWWWWCWCTFGNQECLAQWVSYHPHGDTSPDADNTYSLSLSPFPTQFVFSLSQNSDNFCAHKIPAKIWGFCASTWIKGWPHWINHSIQTFWLNQTRLGYQDCFQLSNRN